MSINIILGGIIVVGAFSGRTALRRYGGAAATGSVTAILALFTLFWVRYQTGMWTHMGLGSVTDLAKKLRRSIL